MVNSIDMQRLSAIILKNNQIDPSFFSRYDVKRGLRNNDGTGVLVGLTQIGDVHGYIVDEKEKVPVEGRLRYRGIDVADLVNGFQRERRFGYEETVYLLLFGQLPNEAELEEFKTVLGSRRLLPDGFTEDMILTAPSSNIMNKLARSVLASYSYDDNAEDSSIENVLRQAVCLIARFPVFVSYGFQAKQHYHANKTLFIHSPDPKLGTAENLLRLIRPDAKYTKLEAELLDLALVLHAEHGGGNNSAFTIHVVSSSDTDTYSAVAAAVGSLKGAKHGGANIKVREMIEDFKANVGDWKDEEEISTYIEKIVRKEAYDKSGLVYGMGHAVYTYSDPRAVLLKEKARILAQEKGLLEEFELYHMIERLSPAVIGRLKGVDKVICANVDFYSGFVYAMLGIPQDLYTPIFAVARIAGWCAHRIEEIINGGRIMRPAYKHIRTVQREYLPLHERV
ncbi:citrate/2-methylcitrate synthase [Sediminispirochaeta smaragdinae]|jgi:citrate synthase|uniref:Citrate synthase n=1 Tax=Sediminispirochaeta smaragdinae (strain DSM 11293 / JCM 15392 / SEBR 4228) TaxID=573413 RepID=E1R4A9_SEDSS|nr:citrate/2-methylcitrate synthase [Sediminispirochaeta smaragdinae]ADK81650.1 Citrate synthase [Sediminispirochaeta smaragdinae DSM 11293]